MDILTSLMLRATLRKAAALEQWLTNHRMCYPGAFVEIPDDNLCVTGRCPCGEEIEITVVIDVVPKVKKKCQAA